MAVEFIELLNQSDDPREDVSRGFCTNFEGFWRMSCLDRPNFQMPINDLTSPPFSIIECDHDGQWESVGIGSRPE